MREKIDLRVEWQTLARARDFGLSPLTSVSPPLANGNSLISVGFSSSRRKLVRPTKVSVFLVVYARQYFLMRLANNVGSKSFLNFFQNSIEHIP
jgi:hypothetical protein